jgi:hypothetical protein
MSKAITCDVILTSASTRADGSLSIRLSTPELPAESKTVFFELLNQNLKMLLQPTDGTPAELHDVKGEFDRKTPSQRLRAVVFIWWKQAGEIGEFDDWYRKKMDVLINYVKDQLKPE